MLGLPRKVLELLMKKLELHYILENNNEIKAPKHLKGHD
jgi:hypothetical protein